MSGNGATPLLSVRGVKTYYGNIIALNEHGVVALAHGGERTSRR